MAGGGRASGRVSEMTFFVSKGFEDGLMFHVNQKFPLEIFHEILVKLGNLATSSAGGQ